MSLDDSCAQRGGRIALGQAFTRQLWTQAPGRLALSCTLAWPWSTQDVQPPRWAELRDSELSARTLRDDLQLTTDLKVARLGIAAHLQQRAHGRSHVDVQPLRVHRVGIRLAAHQRRYGQHGAARLAARRRRVLAAAGAAGRPAQARACMQDIKSSQGTWAMSLRSNGMQAVRLQRACPLRFQSRGTVPPQACSPSIAYRGCLRAGHCGLRARKLQPVLPRSLTGVLRCVVLVRGVLQRLPQLPLRRGLPGWPWRGCRL